ncbi:MAG TPA: hypothetical protein VJ246_02870 [Patescibacteria group bacterium]|nr:hypothetical protein [Patescibacteria group bacterium]
MRIITSVFDGTVAMFALVAWYFTVMRIFAGSWQVGMQQLLNLWPYMTFLIVSFGTYVGSTSFVKRKNRQGTATGVSAGTMVLCCLHHLSDVAILASASSLITVLGSYQPVLLFAGGLANTVMTIKIIRMVKRKI